MQVLRGSYRRRLCPVTGGCFRWVKEQMAGGAATVADLLGADHLAGEHIKARHCASHFVFVKAKSGKLVVMQENYLVKFSLAFSVHLSQNRLSQCFLI